LLKIEKVRKEFAERKKAIDDFVIKIFYGCRKNGSDFTRCDKRQFAFGFYVRLARLADFRRYAYFFRRRVKANSEQK
jgi:hypothetical protein